MVKFSDIFKKKDELLKQGPAGVSSKGVSLKFLKEKEAIDKRLRQQEETGEDRQPVKDASETMRDGLKILDKPATQELYQQAVELLNGILLKMKNNEPFSCKEAQELVEKMAEQVSLGNNELLGLTTQHSLDNYLLNHSVNTCILSLVIGVGLNYPKAELTDLGVAAFLYDIGMSRFEDISSLPRQLTAEEYEQIKQHPEIGSEVLRTCQQAVEKAIAVAHEHHEGVDGKGYPQGLAGEVIDRFARVVTIVDTYEALTHPRAQRDKLVPYDAFKEMFKQKERYDPKILKVFIEQIGIYPVGSWVQLSTSEIGQVISISKLSPLRPIVDVKIDPQGKSLAEERILDLNQYPALHIKRPVAEKEIPL